MAIDTRLKELRESRGLTQSEVAKGVNCSPTAYSRYEKGSREPSINTLVRLAQYYNVSMDYLYGVITGDTAVLSEDEKELLLIYRKLPNDLREDCIAHLQLSLNSFERRLAEKNLRQIRSQSETDPESNRSGE